MEEQEIQDLIRTIIEKLGITIESIEPAAVVGHRMYTVRTPDSKRLIGPQGEHLRALNFILRRYAERIPSLEDTKFMVDVNGYHLTHIQDLETKARLLAERVRTFRSSVEMAPMNAYDRMVVHALFSADPEISTESEGTGPVRHITLKYRSE